MLPASTNRLVLVTTALVAAVGLTEAVVQRNWDQGALFGLILLLQVALLLGLGGRRRPVPIRADLVGWMRDRAAREGDSVPAIADRAISSYRAGLVGPDRVEHD